VRPIPPVSSFNHGNRLHDMTSNSAHRLLLGLQAVVFTVAILYFGRPVLVPFIVAVLLTFLLRPSVVWLERRHVRRALAVGLVGIGVLCAIGSVGWILTRQLHELSLHIDEYRGNLRAKVEALQRSRLKVFDSFRAIVKEVDVAAHQDNQQAKEKAGSPGREQSPNDGATGRIESRAGPEDIGSRIAPASPQPVTVVGRSPSAWDIIARAWDLLSTPLAGLLVVFVLVLFMLADFEGLRNRVIRLAGQGKLTLTTRTLDDASKRISRYLLANALVNGGFGVIVYLGLLAIGVDYAIVGLPGSGVAIYSLRRCDRIGEPGGGHGRDTIRRLGSPGPGGGAVRVIRVGHRQFRRAGDIREIGWCVDDRLAGGRDILGLAVGPHGPDPVGPFNGRAGRGWKADSTV